MHKGIICLALAIICIIPANAAWSDSDAGLNKYVGKPFLEGLQDALQTTTDRVPLISLVGPEADTVCILFAADDSFVGGSISGLLKYRNVKNVPLATRLGLIGRDESYRVVFLFTRQDEFVDLIRVNDWSLNISGKLYYWDIDLSGEYCKHPRAIFFEKRQKARSNYIVIAE